MGLSVMVGKSLELPRKNLTSCFQVWTIDGGIPNLKFDANEM